MPFHNFIIIIKNVFLGSFQSSLTDCKTVSMFNKLIYFAFKFQLCCSNQDYTWHMNTLDDFIFYNFG